MRTSPMTSQMTRFLSILFKDLTPQKLRSGGTGMLRRFGRAQKTSRNEIGFSRFPSRSRGFYHLHLDEILLQPRHEVVEGFPMERFDNENAVRLQRPGAKFGRRDRQVHPTLLVHVRNSGQVRRYVR